jgi:hypothetical protein
MGQRANLVLVDESGYQLYYNHWCANRLDSDLFWGPELAIEYIKQQQPTQQWVSEIWAEGGVVLDIQKRVLLWYGGEDVQDQIPLRRLYLKLMQQVWKGWKIRWAHDGILDMVDYVGVPRSVVEHPTRKDKPKRDFNPSWLSLPSLENQPYIGDIISIRLLDDSIHLVETTYNSDLLLGYGELLINVLQNQPGIPEWQHPAKHFPIGGFHVDFVENKLSIWHAHSPDIVDCIKSHWPGWQIKWLNEDFKAHIALTENRLTLDVPSDSESLSLLEKILLHERSSGVNIFLRADGTLKKLGYEAQAINPNVFHDNPPKTGLELRKKIFQDAVNAWKKNERG